MTNEEWRPVPGWEDLYEVSCQGRVRSLDRTVMRSNNKGSEPAPWTYKGRLLSINTATTGHDYVTLKQRQANRKENKTLHRLVAIAFLGDLSDSHEVDHKDGNPQNNALSNLRWLTRQENMMFSGPAYRVLCEQFGQEKADELVREFKQR